MQVQQQPQARRAISIRTVLLLVFTITITVFAVQNWRLVYVWPFGNYKPLTLVIGLSLALGALIGWLAHSILFGRRGLAPDRNVMREE